MIEANKFKLGLFVIIALTLSSVVLFIIGFSEVFKEKIHFMTVFNESVQGLDVGAPVKYRGVSIGKVTRIAIRPSEADKDKLVTVDMVAIPAAVDPSALPYSHTKDAKEEFFYTFFTKEVDRGLRCRIDMAGITGIKYVEIDYFGHGGQQQIDFKAPPGKFYVPSTPSLFRELSKNISEAINRIASVDFKRISVEVETTLTSVNRYLNDPKISTLIDRLDQISVNLEKTSRGISDSLTKENIDRVVAQLETSMQAFDELAKEIREQVKAAEIDKVLKDMRFTLRAAIQLRNEISETLDSVTEFVQYMSADPGSVIRGKQQPPIAFPQDTRIP